MSDEVKQAAERLRLGRYSSLDDLDEYYMSSRKLEDMEILSGAYLHEHDSETEKENATLLIAEILQASGWVSKPDEFGYPVWCHESCGFGLRWLISKEWGLTCEHIDGFAMVGDTIETVGDLRNLLEALHIPAVIVVPKGGE